MDAPTPAPNAVEFVDCPSGGRQIVRSRRVRLGDVTASGRIRLDAVARYLQDVAADDVDDAGIVGAWVLRRTALRFDDLPRFQDDVELATFCSGTGSRWAERRTTVRVGDAVAVEAAAIWVYVDDAGKPAVLEDWFWDLYRAAANGRTVSGRLRHAGPPSDATSRPWPIRRADFDVLAHVNNAISWAAVEDALVEHARGRRLVAAEIEYRAPVDPGDEVMLRTATSDTELACWLTVDATVRSSVRVELA